MYFDQPVLCLNPMLSADNGITDSVNNGKVIPVGNGFPQLSVPIIGGVVYEGDLVSITSPQFLWCENGISFASVTADA